MKNQMTKLTFLILTILMVTFLAKSIAFAKGEATPEFSIARFVVCSEIADREPVDITTNFSVDTPQAYAFLEAREIKNATEVSFVWSHEGQEVARITVALGQGSRWRTFSSKKLASQKGAWKVELLDINGTVMDKVEFTVE